MSMIVYGPQGSGKSLHAGALRQLFGLRRVVDGYNPYSAALEDPTFKGGKTLYLTNVAPPKVCVLASRRVVHIDAALRQLHQARG